MKPGSWRRAFAECSICELSSWLRTAYRHLVPIRVPLILVVVAAFLTGTIPQIQELFSISVAAVDSKADFAASPARYASAELCSMFISASFLGFMIWYSARTLLRFDVVRTDQQPFTFADATFQEWAPRILGATITSIVALGFTTAKGDVQPRAVCAAVVVVAAASVIVVTWLRRGLRTLLHGTPSAPVNSEEYVLANWRKHIRGRFWVSVAVAFVALSLTACLLPDALGVAAEYVGPLSTLMLLAGLFVAATTPMVLFACHARIPIFALLLVWAISLQKFDAVDNHEILTVATGTDASASRPDDLQQKLNDWFKNSHCEKAYLVSAEGGGIRAGAWTALVLSRLNRELGDANFADCLVAASGVSGGSLGLAAFVAGRQVLQSRLPKGKDRTPCGSVGTQEDQLECRLVYMMTRDFISPTLAAMFTSDQLQRLLPEVKLPDRGSALESAFSRAFDDAFGLSGIDAASESPFGKGYAFSRLYRSDGASPVENWTPILLLNTTEVHSGARILQSGLEIPLDAGNGIENFPDSTRLNDWFAKGGRREVTLLGAIHNSARFSYISPAGTVPVEKNAPAVQVVDGGYFENSGATTLLDLLRLFRNAQKGADAFRQVVVIHISNDDPAARSTRAADVANPGGAAKETSAEAVAKDSKNGHTAAFGEIVPPPYALYMTREARGEYARRALYRMVKESAQNAQDTFVWLRLFDHGGYPLPLGWRIGDRAICEMVDQLEIQPNRDELSKGDFPTPRKALDPIPSEHCQVSGTTAMLN